MNASALGEFQNTLFHQESARTVPRTVFLAAASLSTYDEGYATEPEEPTRKSSEFRFPSRAENVVGRSKLTNVAPESENVPESVTASPVGFRLTELANVPVEKVA